MEGRFACVKAPCWTLLTLNRALHERVLRASIQCQRGCSHRLLLHF